jgi:hypothetical protein
MSHDKCPHDENMPSVEVVESITNALMDGWESAGGVSINSVACGDHFHIYVFPAVRELSGGKHDGEQVFAQFILNLNKLAKAFDKTPRILYDTASRGGMPHMILYGRVHGVKCDITIFPEPPPNQPPMEIAYIE